VRPYKATNDYTCNCWYAMYYWAGAWLMLRDAEDRLIRFATWADAKHAAKLMHKQTRPNPDMVYMQIVGRMQRGVT
jgi:hypothetical protein